MRKIILIFTAIAIIAAAGTCKGWVRNASGPIDRADIPIEFSQLRGGLYIVEDRNYWQENSLVYYDDSGIFFFDSTWRQETANQILWKSAVKSVAEFKGVILTSHQLHRTGGIGSFKRQLVPVYMQRSAFNAMEQQWERMQNEMDRSFGTWRKSNLVYPDQLIDREATLLDGKIQVFYLGDGFSPGNLFVYFPQEKVIYAGSFFADPLYFTEMLQPAVYLATVDRLEQMQLDIETVVCGHGDPVHRWPEFIQRMRLEMHRRMNGPVVNPE